MTEPLAALLAELHTFRDRRGWAELHTPKNLSMAMAAEAGEVLAELQWLTDAEIRTALNASPSDLRDRLADELADVFIYLLLLAESAGVDLVNAASVKNARNEVRFPPPG